MFPSSADGIGLLCIIWIAISTIAGHARTIVCLTVRQRRQQLQLSASVVVLKAGTWWQWVPTELAVGAVQKD